MTDGVAKRERHHLLERQLRRLGLGDEPPDHAAWLALLDRVEQAYQDADQGRELLERSLDISSAEMRGLYSNLQETSELRLAVERDRLRAVFDTVTTGLLVIDDRGTVVSVNPEAVRLLGDASAMVGGPIGAALRIVGREGEPRPLVDAVELEQALSMQRWVRNDAQVMGPSSIPVAVDVAIVAYTDRTTSSVLGGLVVLQDNSEREAARARMAWQANHDSLTGLANRQLFNERLENAMSMARHTGNWPALLFLDLDRFKHVNDSLGHTKGDQLLRAAAERLQRAVRGTDVLARLGGDEFVVLCEGTAGSDSAMHAATRILACMNDPFDLNGEQAFVSASIGLAHAGPSCQHADDLLHDADLAMYRAKERGRNRIEIADDELRTSATERVLLERGLRYALSNGELRVAYQPIRATSTLELVAFEALARWSHPVLGDVAPDRFIPLAEETGLITVLGDRVLDLACRDASSWQRESHRDLGVHVNVSSSELIGPGHLDRVHATMRRHGLASRLLTLELTEGVLLDNPERALVRIEEIRRAGVRVAIDDFGTGYSSLAYLRRFPLHLVKIDREFVSGIAFSHQNQRIVRAVVDLAHGLGYSVVAEGVETAAELDAVRALDCEYVQGHLLGIPMPPEDTLLMATSAPAGAV